MCADEGRIVSECARMWPRNVLDIKDGNKLIVKDLQLLEKPGVYILYRDDAPFYIGKANNLGRRINRHASRPRDNYYNFWNFFSAFVVPQKAHLDEVEGILIAATPTENRAKPRIKKINLPNEVARKLREQR